MLFNHPNMKNHIALICRTVAVHFTDPFHVSTRVADKCNDGTLLLQVCRKYVKLGCLLPTKLMHSQTVDILRETILASSYFML
jgi:hypothetical protein